MVNHSNGLIGSAYLFLAVFIGDMIYTLAPYPMQFLFHMDTSTWTSTWSSSNYAMNTTMVTNAYAMAGLSTPVLVLGALMALALILIWLVLDSTRRFSE